MDNRIKNIPRTDKLRKKRKESRLTQRDMADLLGYAGAQGYNMLEKQGIGLTLEKAKDIADIFNTTIDDLFFKN